MVEGIERPGEQVPQVVRKYLAGVNAGRLAEGFHLPPDVRAVEGPAAAGGEHGPRRPALSAQIVGQQFPQRPGQKDDAQLAFVADLSPPTGDGFGGDEFQLGHPDAGGADGLDDQREALVVLSPRGPDEPLVLRAGQFLFLGEERRLLYALYSICLIRPATACHPLLS